MIKILADIGVILALVPWVSFGLNDMDLQPWTGVIFFALFLIWFDRIKIDGSLLFVFSLMAVGYVVSLLNSYEIFTFYASRMMYAFLSFFLIVVIFGKYLQLYGYPLKVTIIINYVWIAIAVLEVFYPSFSAYFTSQRSSIERGVTSLAPEPTFFGIYLFFSCWLLYLFGYTIKYKWFNLYLINMLSIVLLAQSSLALLYCMLGFIFFAMYVFAFGNVRAKVIVISAFVFFSVALFALLSLNHFNDEPVRIVQQIESSIEKGFMSFYYDRSWNERLQSLVLSFQAGIFYFNFMPGGFDTFRAVQNILVPSWGGFFWYSNGANIILSWVGEYVYHFGLFGIFFIVYFLFKCLNREPRRWFEISFLFIILFSAIPSSFPLIPLIVASYIHSNKTAYKPTC